MATPFMSLNLPTVSLTIGPTWATQINAAITTIDSHTHVAGQGQLIPSAGIGINADLGFANFNLTTIRTSRYFNQSAPLALPTDINCLFVSGGELWFNNQAGVPLQLTQNGSLNVSSIGGITGLGGTTAAVTYNAGTGTFAFTQAPNQAANADLGNVTIRNPIGTSNPGVTLAVSATTSIYSLTLPSALPTSNSLLQLSNSGILSAQNWSVDGANHLNGIGGGTQNVQKAGLLQVGTTNASGLNLFTTNTVRWTIAATGELQGSGGNKAIQNVLNPVNPQDAATKIYVDSKAIAAYLGVDAPNDGGAATLTIAADTKTAFTAGRAATIGSITNDTTGRITITVAGIYRMYGGFSTATSAGAGTLFLFIEKNGARLQTVGQYTLVAGESSGISGEVIASLAANDFIELFYLGSGATFNGNTIQTAQLSVQRIG